LQYLEADHRRNAVTTRTVRLAASMPSSATAPPMRRTRSRCVNVLAVPFRRAATHPIEYFEDAAVQAVLGGSIAARATSTVSTC